MKVNKFARKCIYTYNISEGYFYIQHYISAIKTMVCYGRKYEFRKCDQYGLWTPIQNWQK